MTWAATDACESASTGRCAERVAVPADIWRRVAGTVWVTLRVCWPRTGMQMELHIGGFLKKVRGEQDQKKHLNLTYQTLPNIRESLRGRLAWSWFTFFRCFRHQTNSIWRNGNRSRYWLTWNTHTGNRKWQ